jgi:hypothetical protein
MSTPIGRDTIRSPRDTKIDRGAARYAGATMPAAVVRGEHQGPMPGSAEEPRGETKPLLPNLIASVDIRIRKRRRSFGRHQGDQYTRDAEC